MSKKPNILIIWGDDVGMWNLSCYHRGMMGGSTPNIDRIAKKGMIFMDHYAQASCTAGRAAFITGQYPIRVGLSTVGLAGAPQGMQKEDPTIAELLKPHGYATGQFGKNHLGDRDEHLPTAHGFDEFFGILYHLNAGQYSEEYDYPKDPEVAKAFAWRGVIHSKADGKGGQSIEDKGPFGSERQKTLDNEFMVESKRFITDAVKADKPFFVWHNTTRMHYQTHLPPEYDGVTGYGLYADGVKQMDDHVGELLDLLEELGVADDTFVMFSTDNGAASNSWPDGGNQPFRGEKGVGGYEGGFRVPCVVSWPGHVQENVATGEFMAMEDWMPTILSALGEPELKDELLKGKTIGSMTYKVHLDGYDQTELLSGKGKSKRKDFYYFTETTLHGLRYGDWKFLFKTQDKWFNGIQENLNTPLITNLKLDPFERFHEARGFDEWQENRSWTLAPATAQIAKFMKSLQEYPPRIKSLDFDLDAMVADASASQAR
ncbi:MULTISPECIES: arylsulfatase [Sphingobium]|jgi:arylsulfatase A-like enzyme|uniref:Arylsulfatase n=2 Tax=Sphingobium TaxID=165695 RepID=A0A084ENU6_SPHYA|nr:MULTISPECIES: arylsulfatase [Sphingobium]RSU73618.1 arylsulfatase [Sphingomonas sp. S-NIH.Pt3_0716]AYO79706.1 arylsulfatase [Sphingobium yanoikuyae]KEZ19638.1 Arylsulfatase A family protein [Sphingobium yanoikuyae]KFD29239.1 arylsulfatase [Sphingobium yanoikuyae]KZC83202.1 arylsulfatase [Sphingobium yanoikuyae]